MKSISLDLRVALALLLGLFAFYISLSPGVSAGQGYTGEETESAERILTRLDAWRRGVPAPPMIWSRHGPLPVLFDVPFVALGKFVISPDFAMCFEPALITAAICALMWLWLRKLTSPGMSLVITMIGALGTVLWPYAYIGLETKQSFFVLLAGYLGLACGILRGWPRVLGFAVVCGLAVSLKSTGVVLFPAIAWLLYVQFRHDWRRRWVELVAVLAVMGVIWSAAAVGRNFFWAPRGGGFHSLRVWLIDSPFVFFTNVIGIFGSPTKGIFVYAPVLLLSLYAIPRVFRTHRQTTIFVLALTGGVLVQLGMLRYFADEVWGSRYMHTVIAPALIAIGASRRAFKWRKEVPLLALGALGVIISFLGALYYYGVLHLATMQAGQNTYEALNGDSAWNAIRFHAQLFDVWIDKGSDPVLWTPKHVWMYQPPPGAAPWKTIDLRPLCQPQSFLLRFWHVPKRGEVLGLFSFYLASLIVGVLVLVWTVWKVVQESRLNSMRRVDAIAASAASLEDAATEPREPELDRR